MLKHEIKWRNNAEDSNGEKCLVKRPQPTPAFSDVILAPDDKHKERKGLERQKFPLKDERK